jgi:MFS superfamily sulfate permease-like transporter
MKNFKYDISAGLVVYLVALPLCLGIGLASTGRPDLIFSGIIAGVVGGIVVGSFSGSQLGVSGPAAGLVAIVLTALDTLNSFEVFLLAVMLSGLIQLIASYLRAGVIGYYFPSSVIKGMLAAIGLILVMKEIPHLLGVDEDYLGDLNVFLPDGQNTFSMVYYSILHPNAGAVIIGIFSLLILIIFEQRFMKKWVVFKFLPGALFVVVFGALINSIFLKYVPEFFMSGNHLVQLPVADSMQSFMSFFHSPDFSAFSNIDVYGVAFTLAIVASLETLLSVEATDKLDPYKRITPTNRELKAQGIGNMISGFIGGLPITQVIVRSSANINAGGKTKLSTIIHGVILLVTVAFIPGMLNLIPLASLAAILLMVGYKLAQPILFKSMFKLGWEQFLPFFATIVAVLATDLLKGIGVGMAIALFFILRKNYSNPYTYSKQTDDHIITLILSEEVSFLNKASIYKALMEIEEGSTVIIDGSQSKYISFDVLERIEEFQKFTAPKKNIQLSLVGIHRDKS